MAEAHSSREDGAAPAPGRVPPPDDRVTRWAALVCGVSAGVGQVLLARELLAVLYGNELCLGAVLGGWLLWGALGSLLAGRSRARGPGPTAQRIVVLQLATPLLLMGSLAAVRAIPALLTGLTPAIAAKLPPDSALARFIWTAFAANPGEVIGLVPTVLLAGLAAAPLAACFGAQFVLISRLYTWGRAEDAGRLGRIYAWEAFGDFVGAGALSLAIVHHVSPFYVIAVVAGAVGWCAVRLATAAACALRRPTAAVAALLFIAMAIWARPLQEASLELRWRGFEVVAHRSSVYGRITVTRQGALHSIYASGLRLFDTPVPEVFQELVHYPLLAHSSPRRVLLIGGGVGGALREVLQHGPDKIDYVELDPELVEATEPLLAPADRQALRDPRVHVHPADGRRFIQQQGRTGARYDVVLLLVPDPASAQLNRFYTAEFYAEVARVLAPGGLLAFHMSSSEGYFSPAMKEFNVCILRTLRTAFGAWALIPGEQACVLATVGAQAIGLDADLFEERLHERGVDAIAVESMLRYKLDLFRRDMVLASLAEAPPGPLNTDPHPICYYYNQALWTTWFHPGAEALFERVAQAKPGTALLWLCVGLAALALFAARFRGRQWDVTFATAATGLAGMSLEFVLLLAFQTLYGSVYHKLGILVGSFMLGLALGALIAARLAVGAASLKLGLAIIAAAVAGLSALLPSIIAGVGGLPAGGLGDVLAQAAFPLLTGVLGALVGAAYPFATGCLRAMHVEAGRASGTIYAADLLGACLGAAAISIVLAPILGLVAAAGIVGAANGLGALVLCGVVLAAAVRRR